MISVPSVWCASETFFVKLFDNKSFETFLLLQIVIISKNEKIDCTLDSSNDDSYWGQSRVIARRW